MRTKQTNTCSSLLGICFTSIVVACSSGGADSNSNTAPPPTATSAEGLWMGTTSTGRTVGGVVLDDGSYWVLYTALGNPNVVAGLIQGNGASQLGSFTSSNTKDFNLEGSGIQDATIDGSYVEKQSLNGTIAYINGNKGSFTSTYDADYELTPDMNLIAGTYTGPTADGQTVTVIAASDGTISGHSTDGCTFTGSFAPRAKGNVFNVIVTFGGGPCSNGTDTVNGVAFFDTATRRLHSAAVNNTRTNGFVFIGTKL
jgi:hypothetical protein